MRHVIIALCLVVALGCQTVPLAPAEAPSAREQAFNHYLMGDIHRRNGRFEQAITEFVTAHEYAPDDPNLVKHIIRGYLMIHDLEKARTYADDLATQFLDGRLSAPAPTLIRQFTEWKSASSITAWATCAPCS